MPSTMTLALIIFLLPVISFTILALAHPQIPRHGDWLGTGALGAAFACALVVFGRAWASPDPLLVNYAFDWLPVTGVKALTGGLMVDRLSAVMLVVVTTVSFLVHLFSQKYMESDSRYGRYYCGLSIFSASMLGLVIVNNMLYLFACWELVGLSSYLLIGHFYEKKSASNAAIKAFITTRVGDVGMFIGLLVCYFQVGSLQFADIFAAVETGQLAGNWRTIAGIGIFFGAMGKSAQFPLHVWLPDAMEGPTPVSALIHAATMVAAGVYLTGRVLPLFDAPSMLFIAYIGGFTALFAATIAVVQDDIKKVLAYSTVSQLGYMILALGVGGYTSGLFHLTTHAFFKAGLFLGSGAVIYAMHHEQSMSQYGGLFKKLPITATCYLLATLALCGVPPFAGFFSKDAILGDSLAFSLLHGGHWFLPFAGFFTAFLTAFYMCRQYLMTFFGKPRNQEKYDHAHEVPWHMYVPLIVLGTLATVGGLGGWFNTMNPKLDGMEQIRLFHEHGYDSELVSEALAMSPAHETASESHVNPAGEVHSEGAHEDHAAHVEHVTHQAHLIAMALSIPLALLGVALGFVIYWERRDGTHMIEPKMLADKFRPVHTLLFNKYYIDELYWKIFIMPVRIWGVVCAMFDRGVIDSIVNFFGGLGKLGGYFIKWVDSTFVDGVFVMGTAKTAAAAGEGLSQTETGRVRQYMTMTVAGVVIIACAIIVWVR